MQQHQLEHAGFLLAYSGGLDSTVLLSLFARLRQQQPHLPVRAIHIHHGLSPNADQWAQHCRQQCKQFNIALIIEKVRLNPTNGVEEAARRARYHAFKPHLQPNELLVTAHHLNDQSENLLLALKRGSGIKGLAAMQVRSELWQMAIFRPLLRYSREQLEQYALAQGLNWVEDESNQDTHYDRNFLRHGIMPALRQRWPTIDRTFQRSAQHCFEQQQLLEELLSPLFQQLYRTADRTLDIAPFHTYSRSKQHFLLRLWLEQSAVEMPSQRQLNELIDNLIFARRDSQPQLQLGQRVIRRHQHRLYLTALYADISTTIIKVELEQSVTLPDNLGTLCFQVRANGLNVIWRQTEKISKFVLPPPPPQQKIEIRFAYSGKVRLAAERANQDIKKIWQQSDIPPWQRQRTPLVCYGETLIAGLGVFIKE
ncbi:tRNA(Ile)-lysidine synthase [Chelonobacter oris]|uniref:tRNA(Ile)-lysidine synthase n=1 Tax=Chelonobacter oris TaxID=505317 RepID=A0A0A3APG3_9PAST|nr:tRNA(Ile)-lysidine synthetase [Chelonobacter oris]MDH3001361.1 tRNA(Ile)-lysidine synthase [Chelonobacter oris]